MTRTGPNDARRVVWAIGEFFKYISLCFYILTNILSTYRCNLQGMERGRAVMMRTGPQDARHVIWAIGEFFSNFFRVLLKY